MNRWRKDSDLKRLFTAVQPEVPDELVERLSARVSRPRAGRSAGRRLALAGAFSALVLGTLASVGGIGYAATLAKDVITGQTVHRIFFGSRMSTAALMSALPQVSNAATDQYGQSSNATTTTVQSNATTTQTITAGSASVAIPPSAAAQIVADAGGSAQIHVDPTPPTKSTALAAVGIVITNSTGQVIHPTLTAAEKPLAVNLPANLAGSLPCIDRGDGRGCVPIANFLGSLTSFAGTCADLGATGDAYYVDTTTGHIVILTCHLTIFAVVSKANLTVSATGRKLAPANSGKFGDAALYIPAAAQIKQVGTTVKVYPFKHLSGRAVHFKFFVNEQVAAYIQLFKGSTRLPIRLHGTMLRGTTLSKNVSVKTLHIAILAPGTWGVRLRTIDLKAGAKYRIRVAVLNFDGTKTVHYIPFTG